MAVGASVLTVLLGGAPLVWIATSFLDDSLFSYHVALMWAGFAIFPALALIAIRARRAAAAPSTRTLLTQAHSACLFLAEVCLVCGLVAIYRVKEGYGKPHLTSWHSWVGVAAVALLLLNGLGGFATSVLGPLLSGKPTNFLWVNPVHVWSGRVALLAGLGAIALGLGSSWAQQLGVAGRAGSLACVVLGYAVAFFSAPKAHSVEDAEKPKAA